MDTINSRDIAEEPTQNLDILNSTIIPLKTLKKKRGKKSTEKKPPEKKRWIWTDEIIETLLRHLLDYKNEMVHSGYDFQSDLVACYAHLRKKLAQQFEGFGPIAVPNLNKDCTDKEELIQFKRRVDAMEKEKKEGYARIRVKVKDLRSGYKIAVDKGTRSGSGRLVYDHFDILSEIWRGSPAVSSLDSAVSSIAEEEDENNEMDSSDEHEELCNANEDVEGHDVAQTINRLKDTKRNKMRKKLSAHQKDMMQLDFMQREIDLKERAINLLEQSAKANEQNLRLMSKSISEMGQGIKDDMGILAGAMIQCQQMSIPQQNPYMYHPPQINTSFMASPPTHTPQ